MTKFLKTARMSALAFLIAVSTLLSPIDSWATSSLYTANNILNYLLKNTNMPASPATVYLSLHNGAPGSACTSNDVTTTVHSAGRLAVAISTYFATSSSAATISNTTAIDFGNSAGAVTGTLQDVSIWDASSAGNCLAYAAISPAVAVASGQDVQFGIGALTFTAN